MPTLDKTSTYSGLGRYCACRARRSLSPHSRVSTASKHLEEALQCHGESDTTEHVSACPLYVSLAALAAAQADKAALDSELHVQRYRYKGVAYLCDNQSRVQR